jgi:hypothetical protein
LLRMNAPPSAGGLVKQTNDRKPYVTVDRPPPAVERRGNLARNALGWQVVQKGSPHHVSKDDRGSNVSRMKSHRRAGIAAGRVAYWLGGLAAFGIVAAHCLAYIIVAPDAAERATLLHRTGHHFWGLVFALALGVGTAGLSGVLVRFIRLSTTEQPKVNLFGYAALRLMALQVGGFVLLETSERIFLGNGAHAIVEPVVIVGLALQVAVALAAALILSLLTKTLYALLSGTSPNSAKAARILPRFARTRWLQPSLAPGTGAGSLRGPPLRP